MYRSCPSGEAGGAFVAAYADLAGLTISTELVDGLIVTSGVGSNTGLVQVLGSDRGTGIPFGQTSRPIGEAIAALVRSGSAVATRRRSGRPVGA